MGPGRPCGTCLRIVPSPKGLRMPLCYSCPCLVPGMSSWPCLRTNPASLSLTPGHEKALGAEVQELPTAALPRGRARMASLPLLRARVAGRQCCCGLLGAPVGSDQAGTCCAYNKPHRSQPLPRASRLQEAGGPPLRPRWALNAFNGQSELTAWAPTSRKVLVLGRTYPTSPLT